MNFRIFAALIILSAGAGVYGENEFTFRLMPVFTVPAGVKNFRPGFGAAASLDWTFLSFGKFGAGLSAGGGFSNLGIEDGSAFTLFEGNFGPVLNWRPLDRLSLRADINAGAYRYQWNGEANSRIRAGAGLSAFFHLTPAAALYGTGSYTWYAFSADKPINAITLGAGVQLNLSEILKPQTRVKGEKTEQRPVFPVSYAWYENNPVARVIITNNEKTTVTGINASFFMEQYMNEPAVFASIPRLLPGQSVELPVTALFNESMLNLTENINTNALVLIDYRNLGSKKRAYFGMRMPVYHRNAMSWDDDRRAASFVSDKDPAARLFARYVGSVVDKGPESSLPQNIRYALALFEALRVYGINYIIDPASAYREMSGSASSLDSLNYPYQTLFYRGGDCDDLSILYCSTLEALGIDTAFITIPGHIYAAFDTGLRGEGILNLAGGIADTGGGTQNSALQNSNSKFINYNGKYWLPVEITIPGRGFYQAWRTGAREWHQAAGNERAIYPMRDSWELYPAVSAPNAAGRMPDLPEEAVLLQAVSAETEKLGY
jgi:hypothetical protein